MSREIKTNINEQGTEVAASIVEENASPESATAVIADRAAEAGH